MACLTGEQLARMALGLEEGERLPAHVEACETCRAELTKMRRLAGQLSAAHAELDRTHAATRSRLLASLSSVEMPAQPVGVWNRLISQFGRLTMRQRIAAAGVGFSTMVGLVLLLLAFNSASQLSAMERMIKQLREVTSFSYELEETIVRAHGEPPSKIQRNDTVYWRAPASLRASTKIVKFPEPLPPGDWNGELRSDIVEIYTAGHSGVFVNHKDKTFFRVPELIPNDFPDYSPITWLRKIAEREGSVTVVRDLGAKPIDGKKAHGYVMSLNNPNPDSGQNAIHVWLDPETDLPLEFSYEEKGDAGTTDAWTNVLRVTNCRWNIELDSKLFDTTPPEGYDDITPPSDDKALKEIVAALELYAELSGGQYPRVSTFDAEAIHEEMLKLARFTGPPHADWSNDEKFQRIQQADNGLDWIARILRNAPHHSNYFGQTVGPQDKDKVLLWWTVDAEDLYRVFYGDLRTEIVSEAKWSELVAAGSTSQGRDVEPSPSENR